MTSTNTKRHANALGAAILALLAVCLIAGPAPARAAFGDLSFRNCVAAENVAGRCTGQPQGGLVKPLPIAVSPDGKSVYTATDSPGAFVHLVRSPDSALNFESCLAREITNGGTLQCADTPNLVTLEPRSIVVSPDGQSIYGTSADEEAVSHFFRTAPLGRPAYDGCVSSLDTAVECEVVAQSPLSGASGLAIDPAGRSLYVASFRADSLSVFDLLSPGGQLDFEKCFDDSAENGCADLPGEPLELARATAVSPDGESIYVAGSQSIAWFERDALGAVQYRGCFGHAGGIGECGSNVTGAALNNLLDVAVSSDGTSLYAVSPETDAILAFARGADGSLAYQGCFSSDDLHGCAGVPGTPLNGAVGVEVSPDGRSVYVLAGVSGAVVHFQRAAGGALSFRSCVAKAEISGAGCALVPAGTMALPFGLAVSPDGASVYVTGTASNSVVAFTRSQVEDPPPPPPGPPVAPDRPSARCGGKPATIVGTPRADTLRGTPRRDVIAGLGGGDTIRGRGGKDLICGGKGKDTILGGGGEDRCLGGPGADELGCERGRGRRG